MMLWMGESDGMGWVRLCGLWGGEKSCCTMKS